MNKHFQRHKCSIGTQNFFLDRKLKNQPHQWWSKASVTEKNIRAVHNLIDSERRIKISEIVSAVGVIYGSVEAIISNMLNFWKVSVRWVPHLHTQEQKHVHLDVCESLLTHYEEERDDFFTVFSLVMKRGSTTTPLNRNKQAWSGKRRRSSVGQCQNMLACQLEKSLRPFFGHLRNSVDRFSSWKKKEQ